MKPNLILILLTFSVQFSLAQHWKPFHEGETYNYLKNDTANVYSNTISPPFFSWGCYSANPYPFSIPYTFAIPYLIESTNELQVWVDSIYTIALDTIYLFNRRVIPCDTCSTPAIIVNQPLNYAILQDSFIKNVLGQYIFMYQGDSIILDPALSINDTLISDFSSFLISRIIHEGVDTIWYDSTTYIIDSTKLINYYQGNLVLYEIYITKNHGIKYFEDKNMVINNIEQIGLESKKLGATQLKVSTIYNFNVGDVFFYRTYSFGLGEYECHIIKREIIARQELSPDSIYYTENISDVGITNSWPPGMGSYNYTNYFSVIDEQVTPSYPFTSLEELENFRDNELIIEPIPNMGYYNTVGLVKNFLRSGSRQYKSIFFNFDLDSMGFSNYDLTSPIFSIDTMPNPSNVYYLFEHPFSYNFSELYGEGLGKIANNSGYFEGYSSFHLIGYIKGNDTVGTIMPDVVFTDVEEIPATNTFYEIKVYPNPAHNEVNIELDEMPIIENLQVKLINLQGKVLRYEEIKPSLFFTISIEDLSAGLYFLELWSDKQKLIGRKKIVVL